MSEHHGHYISSAGRLWAVAIGLFILTFLTVAVTYVEIPEPFNLVVALGIAFFKAFLVAAFFMNLWYDIKFNTMLLLAGVTFFILMFSITLLDTMFRADVVPSF
jgi:cytochrome c oxidase subunit 4